MALAAALTTAVVQPQRVPESVVALAGAALLVAAGVLDGGDARDEAEAIG